MILKIFTQPNCSQCPPAKDLAKRLAKESGILSYELETEMYDTTTVEGMAEGAFYQVMGTPTVLLCDDNGKVVAEWRGKVPTMADLNIKMQNAK